MTVDPHDNLMDVIVVAAVLTIIGWILL